MKNLYHFSAALTDGDASMVKLLGGKGANLAEMSRLGVKVPPGFTLTTETCRSYYRNKGTISESLWQEICQAVNSIGTQIGKNFGDAENPLLISVRSGAPCSMPGMMDSILNLGLNCQTVEGLAKLSNNRRFAFDSYRRFLQMYAEIVLKVEASHFEDMLEATKLGNGVKLDSELSADALEELCHQYHRIIKTITGKDFPEDVHAQLKQAICAVYDSWMNERAITYRQLHKISADTGTAINIQSMVFGNLGPESCTGVLFTRDPSSGENKLYGEYLANAQGEDVVAGTRTPLPIRTDQFATYNPLALETTSPKIFKELSEVSRQLEAHYRDMQDIEFTVEQGKLWILQTRTAKRSSSAAIKIAADLANENIISRDEALMRLDANSLDRLLHPTIAPGEDYFILDKGLPASPGAASGKVVFSASDAERLAANNIPVILVRNETSPEDIKGMIAARAIVTCRGGMTSHAAVVARGMGKVCVCAASNILIDLANQSFSAGDSTVKAGDTITVNGSTGEVILGDVPTVAANLSPEFIQLMQWADERRRLKLRANAETPRDVSTALQLGAEGIGLCRTEHMFFEDNRITYVRKMILAQNQEERLAHLEELAKLQEQDFIEIFELMHGMPITVRLLDPPLHEFLPHGEEECAYLAEHMGISIAEVRTRVEALSEVNPMLGHRGVRLAITWPEIYQMQAKAMFKAQQALVAQGGKMPMLEIMVPFIICEAELIQLKRDIATIADEIISDSFTPSYLFGTMIELPRAALMANQLATNADFFSFGTNDLTQSCMGMSRDDSSRFLAAYQQNNLIIDDPFVVFDREGVGQLVSIATERGRSTNTRLKLGICGEHGGHPSGIEFAEELKLDYVSCSPFRIPVARLSAAQAAIKATAATSTQVTNVEENKHFAL